MTDDTEVIGRFLLTIPLGRRDSDLGMGRSISAKYISVAVTVLRDTVSDDLDFISRQTESKETGNVRA